jgi:hypothetical protein
VVRRSSAFAVRFMLVVDFGLDRRSAAALLLEELRA